MVVSAVTEYVNILVEALNKLHVAYPDQQIELRAQEIEPGGWQCYIELREHGICVARESFYINPPTAPQTLFGLPIREATP